MPRTFAPFASWPDVLAHVAAGHEVWYHAPLDLTPRLVLASVKGKRPTKVRVVPLSNQADPFQADSGHLPRFRRMVDTPEVAGCDYGPAGNVRDAQGGAR